MWKVGSCENVFIYGEHMETTTVYTSVLKRVSISDETGSASFPGGILFVSVQFQEVSGNQLIQNITLA